MLGPVEDTLIRTILGRKNADEIVLELMNRFAKTSWQHSRALLNTIPQIADVAYKQMAEKLQEQRMASYMLICQRGLTFVSEKYHFASMVPVCKAVFPAGNADRASFEEKRYFQEFLELFQDPKAFNWEDDGTWAETQGYTNYLKLVESQIKGNGGQNGT